jgi:hypothetical protein
MTLHAKVRVEHSSPSSCTLAPVIKEGSFMRRSVGIALACLALIGCSSEESKEPKKLGPSGWIGVLYVEDAETALAGKARCDVGELAGVQGPFMIGTDPQDATVSKLCFAFDPGTVSRSELVKKLTVEKHSVLLDDDGICRSCSCQGKCGQWMCKVEPCKSKGLACGCGSVLAFADSRIEGKGGAGPKNVAAKGPRTACWTTYDQPSPGGAPDVWQFRGFVQNLTGEEIEVSTTMTFTTPGSPKPLVKTGKVKLAPHEKKQVWAESGGANCHMFVKAD